MYVKIQKTLVGLSILLLSNLLVSQALEYPPEYVAYYSPVPIKIDGDIEGKEWEKAVWTDYFVDIEGEKKDKPYLDTRVKMLWDDEYFYFAVELKEPHLWATLKERDAVIFHDNDFEVFIDPDGDNHMYYEFEMNALNTVWDLFLVKPYRDGGPAIDSWDMRGLKTNVKLYGTLNDNSDEDAKWTLEIAMPWIDLEEANKNQRPKDGTQWRVNFSRVQWQLKKFQKTYTKELNLQTGKPLPENNWVWSPQGVIAMHQPETWGYVQFSKIPVGTGTADFIKDPNYLVKSELMEIYYAQKKYYKNYGVYTADLSLLGINNEENRFVIQATAQSFHVSAQGEGCRLSVNQEGRLDKREYPTFWTWMSAGENIDWESRLGRLDSMGIKGIVLKTSVEGYKRVVPIARKYGMTVTAWVIVMNGHNRDTIEAHPEWLDYNRNGDPLNKVKAYVNYYKFMNPSLPEVRRYLKNEMAEICSIDGIDGISLDYCRYVDVILPEDIQPNYNIVQDKEYPQWDYGYHPYSLKKFEEKYGYNPQELKDPSKDANWLNFRYDEVTYVARMLGEVAHSHGKTISASPFPSPSVAKKIVRQDWGNWRLDYVFPMVYFPFYKKEAEWVAQVMQENAKLPRVGNNVYCGLICYASDHDASRERPSLAKPMQIAFDNGARGICFFSEGSFRKPQVRDEITRFIHAYNKKHK